MTSLRRAAVLAVMLLPASFVYLAACGTGGTQNPPPPPPVADTGMPDTGVRDTATPDTTLPDTAPADTGMPDTGPADTGEAAVEAAACEAGAVPSVVTPALIEFGQMGLVPCGTTAAPETITLTNTSCTPFTWMAASTGGGYMLSPSSSNGMMLMPGATQMITVLPAMIPPASAVTPDLYQGTVTITTDYPNDTAHIVALHETAYGAILVSTLGGSFGFGGVPIGQVATDNYSITNNGNAQAPLTVAVGSMYFGFPPTLPTTTAGPMQGMYSVPANSSVAPNLAFVPQAAQMYTDTIITSVASGTPLCGPLPGNAQITGSGTAGVGVSPTSLDFGKVPCQSGAAMAQTFTLKNTGTALNYTMTLALGANSPYTLSNPMGSITPGIPYALGAASSVVITVTPNAIPYPASTAADGYADTLTITTDFAGDVPHVVSLHQTAQGTIFTLGPSTTNVSGPPANTITSNFTVGNSGNVAAGYTLSFAPASGQVSILSPPNTLLASSSGTSFGPTLALTVQGNSSSAAQANCSAGGTCVMSSAGSTSSTSGMLSPGVTEMGTLSVLLPPLTIVGDCADAGNGTGTCPVGQNCDTTDNKCVVTFQTLSAIHLTPSPGADGGALILCADIPPDIQLDVHNVFP